MTDGTQPNRIRELFDRAADLDPKAREALLASIDDAALVARVRALLAQDSIETLPALQRSMATLPLPRIDKYELLRPLGEGGMGEVFFARQLEPVERHVAIKVLRGHDSTPTAMAWFERERQTLARMNHPGIAQIYDGGRTDDGSLYLVMEYVRGEALTAWCEKRSLPLRARIALFGEVCDAVQHAHQKAVIHRDLKPDNVLVTEREGKPCAKVIDFGIARSLRNDGKDAAIEERRAPGTWRYMSPEQRNPDASGLDTRSDVYSLGVMLYELIVGSNPHAGAPQDAQSDLQPRAPSAELLRLGDAKLAERAAALATTPRELLRALQPDLDAVTQRAMSTDRDGRYASAAELRADLDRFRRYEPVAAAPSTWSYLASRFLARHRAITIASALAVASLIGAVLGLGYGALEAKEAEAARANAQARAMRQLTRAAAQLEFQDLVLFHLDAGVDDTSPSLRSVLDLLAPTISARFGLNALEESGVRTSVGHAYLAVGEPHKALPQLERALELSEMDLESDGAASIALLNDLARASRLAGDADAGSKRLAQMLRVGSRDLRASEPQLAATFASLASLATTAGRDAEFLQSYDRALAAVEAMPRSSESARLVLSLAGATGLLIADSNRATGPDLLARIGRFLQRLYADEVDSMFPLVRLAERLMRLGSHGDAMALAQQAFDALDRIEADRHWMRMQCARVRGLCTALSGSEAEGEDLLVALRFELCDLPETANEQARLARNALVELCARLSESGRLDAFLDASLARWRSATDSASLDKPWWPVAMDEVPAAIRDAATRRLQQIPDASRTARERGAIGSALLRAGQHEAALRELEAATSATTPAPELLADQALAAQKSGRLDALERAVTALRQLAESAPDDKRARVALEIATSLLAR
ncbi:MAG: Serine/threonine-protein kinase PknB [Planctomycetota bacterium]